jgi:hypothetical protein
MYSTYGVGQVSQVDDGGGFPGGGNGLGVLCVREISRGRGVGKLGIWILKGWKAGWFQITVVAAAEAFDGIGIIIYRSD